MECSNVKAKQEPQEVDSSLDSQGVATDDEDTRNPPGKWGPMEYVEVEIEFESSPSKERDPLKHEYLEYKTSHAGGQEEYMAKKIKSSPSNVKNADNVDSLDVVVYNTEVLVRDLHTVQPDTTVKKAVRKRPKNKLQPKQSKPVESEAEFYKCEDCDKIFTAQKFLKQHIHYMHNKERLYECNFCQEKFTDKFDLMNHKFIHMGQAPVYSGNSRQCNICFKMFNYSYNLKRHMKEVHSTVLYECNFCTKKFKCLSILKKHISCIHLKEKPTPLECDVCQKNYATYSSLNRHKLIHVNLKPYACGLCPKKFNDASTLRQHTTIHTGERPFECSVCNKTFRLSGDLNKHILLHARDDLKPKAK